MKKIIQNDYFRLKSNELLFSIEQSRKMIMNHNLSRGLIAESVLRNFLKSFLPNKVGITQGFIVYQGIESPQCDIILYDCLNYAPIYKYGDFDVVQSDAVFAVIEVKISVNRKGFGKVLHDFERLYEMGILHKFLFIYDGVSLNTLKNYFWGKYVPDYGRKQNEFLYDHDNYQALPESIISLKPNYYLKQDYCIIENDDMKGYMSYSVLDTNDKEVSSIQSFLQDIIDITSPSESENKEISALENLKSVESINDFKDMIAVDSVPLFRI